MTESQTKTTLCWDCAKYQGDCSWSRSFIPVKGWDATPVEKKNYSSYSVRSCPEFKRDAYNNGTRRMK